MFARHRRLRAAPAIRDLVRETALTPHDFIYPIFVAEGWNIKAEIAAMPGNFHFSVDRLPEIIEQTQAAGVRGVLLWNTWDQVEAARKLIAEPGPVDAGSVRGRLPA